MDVASHSVLICRNDVNPLESERMFHACIRNDSVLKSLFVTDWNFILWIVGI